MRILLHNYAFYRYTSLQVTWTEEQKRNLNVRFAFTVRCTTLERRHEVTEGHYKLNCERCCSSSVCPVRIYAYSLARLRDQNEQKASLKHITQRQAQRNIPSNTCKASYALSRYDARRVTRVEACSPAGYAADRGNIDLRMAKLLIAPRWL